MEFLHLCLRCHFPGKPVVALQNVCSFYGLLCHSHVAYIMTCQGQDNIWYTSTKENYTFIVSHHLPGRGIEELLTQINQLPPITHHFPHGVWFLNSDKDRLVVNLTGGAYNIYFQGKNWKFWLENQTVCAITFGKL